MRRRVAPGPVGFVGTPCNLRAQHRRAGTSKRWRMRSGRGWDGRLGGMIRLRRRCRRRSDGRRGGGYADVWRNLRSGRGCRLNRRSCIPVRELAFWNASCCVFELERAAARAGLAGVRGSCEGGGPGGGYGDGMGMNGMRQLIQWRRTMDCRHRRRSGRRDRRFSADEG